MNAKTIAAVAVATVLFSGSALAMSGNPENPNAATHNWQLDELRQSVNNQFSDVNNRIDQIQAGSSFDASDIYDRLDTHDKQIGDLNIHVNGLDVQVSNIGRDVNELKDQVNTKVDKDDFLKDQQKQNDRMDGMQNSIDNNSGRLDAVENSLNDTTQRLNGVEGKVEQANNTANKAVDMAQDSVGAALDAKETAHRVENHNKIQDAHIADLQANKVDRSELEDVAIKADGALAGAIENRNQIDQIREDLADTDKQVTTNKKDIADLKNQNGALNNAAANAQDTANTASAKADKAQNTADKAAAGVNNVKNDVKVVSRDVANNSIRIQRNEERIDGAYAGIYDNRKNIETNRQAINRNSQEIQKLNKNFNDLKNTVDANRKRAAAGIAGVAAMANIPEVNSHQTFSVGVGVGGFDGQQAVAVGASARVNDNLTVKASVAANNEEVVWGAGAAFGW